MSNFDQRGSYKPFPRKRKRQFSPNIGATTSEGLLQLNEPKQSKVGNYNIPDEDKVMNSLNKLGYKTTGYDQEKIARIRIIIGVFEAEYFETREENLIKQLITSFGIQDLKISEYQEGSVERIITLVGEAVPISRAAVFIGFLLVAKVNNFLKNELFTLKTSNYRLRLLISINRESWVRDMSKHFGIVDYDTSIPFTYNQNPNLYTLTVTGGFHSLIDFLTELTYKNSQFDILDDLEIKISKLAGIHPNGNLFQRKEAENKTLNEQSNKALDYIYSNSLISNKNN